MIDKPTEAQLRFLNRLKYTGAPPQTKAEASFLIDGRKSSRNTSPLDKKLAQIRQKAERDWYKEGRDYRRRELQQARSSGGFIVGFRVFVGRRCDKARQYHAAFLPIQVALKHRELLPPYKGVCKYELCECEFECVLDSDRLIAV